MNSTTSIFPENHCPGLTFRDRLVQPVPQWDGLHGSGRSASSSLGGANLYPHGVLLREISSYWDTIFSTYRICAT
jgi:hypothetical protein